MLTELLQTTRLRSAAAITAAGLLTLAGCQMYRPVPAGRAPGDSGPQVKSTPPASAPQRQRNVAFTQPGVGYDGNNLWPALLDESVTTDEALARRRRSPAVDAFGRMRDDTTERTGYGDAAGGFRQHTFGDEGFDTDVTLSPDGQSFVYASTRHADTTDIYLQRVDGQAVVQLTADPAEDMFPAFSPDGTKIAFASNRSGNWDIYVMDVDGRNVVQMTRTPSDELHPSWSPDGTRLVYCATGQRSGQWEMWVIRADGSSPTMIGPGLFPVWSPDPSQDVIAFQRARQRGTRWYSLWTCRLEPSTTAGTSGEAKAFTEVAASTNAAIVAPAWSPDGKQLAFGTVIHTNDGTVGGQDIWVVDNDGGQRRRLTDGIGLYASPSWGTGGRVYFTSDRNGKEAIWSVHASEADIGAAFAGAPTD